MFACVQSLEDLENALEVLWAYADPIVADGKDPVPLFLLSSNVDSRRGFLAELDGIAHEVLK